ncbi:hypothetical protein [Streptomyces sp. NPDC051554]|uniref:hypothetical protein n=1 Tax=Streptomyces sp. NPDC051554 TaxID=3365656 RepID=UPI003799B402
MSERDELEPLTIELRADAGALTDVIRRVQSSMMFAFHPDLSTAAERAARCQLLSAWQAGEDFRESMATLAAQVAASPEEVRRLQAAVLRLGGVEES